MTENKVTLEDTKYLAFSFTAATEMFTGWTVNRAIKNKTSKRIVEAFDEISTMFPYPMDHLHSDNSSEFLNEGLFRWTKREGLACSRSRPDHSNDN